MLSTLAVLAITLGFLHNGETLECYKCTAFKKDDPSECLYVDDKTETMTCADNEKYCSAIGVNHVEENGTTTYSNIRRCEISSHTCLGIYYGYQGNMRNCELCATDKCNTDSLLPQSESAEETQNNVGDNSNPAESGDVPEDANGNSTGGAETDEQVEGGVNSK